MDVINTRYSAECGRPSDINEHLPTLRAYAAQCTSVAEMGVRAIVSTWALLKGLAEGEASEAAAGPDPAAQKVLLCVDIEPIPGVDEVLAAAAAVGVHATFMQGDSAKVDLGRDVDMLFIDTWHIYGHLKRDLAQHAGHVKKFIALHDTEVDKVAGESIRMGLDIAAQAAEFGYPVEEITQGLGRALEEFLAAHASEWEVAEHFDNNNGLTVLRRRGPPRPAAV